MTNNQAPNRYEGYQTPEDQINGVKQGSSSSRTFDQKINDTYRRLKQQQERESFGEGPDRKNEVLGKFQKSALSIRGLRSRGYKKAMELVAYDERKIADRQAKIDALEQEKNLYGEALNQIKQTTSWWRLDQKAELMFLKAQKNIRTNIEQSWHGGIKRLWEAGKSVDEWFADVMRGDLDQKYARAIQDLKATANMEKIIGQYYTKALVFVDIKELEMIATGEKIDEKKKKLQELQSSQGESFIAKWKELQGMLSNNELNNLYALLRSKLPGKEQQVVKKLQTQINAVYARGDVHDYQEIKYLRDVQKNVTQGKEKWQLLGLKGPQSLDNWQGQMWSLYNTSPNLAYMLCDAADHYKQNKEDTLAIILKQLLVKEGKPNDDFLNKVKGIDFTSVNNLIKVDFYVKTSLDSIRTSEIGKLQEILRTKKDAITHCDLSNFAIDQEFRNIPLLGGDRPLLEVAYDVYKSGRIQGIKRKLTVKIAADQEKKMIISLKIAAVLLQFKGQRIDPEFMNNKDNILENYLNSKAA